MGNLGSGLGYGDTFVYSRKPGLCMAEFESFLCVSESVEFGLKTRAFVVWKEVPSEFLIVGHIVEASRVLCL